MQKRSLPVYERLAHEIKNMGVEVAFGLMSDDTALLVTSLDSIGVKFRGARHENNGIAMAEGYAAATGKIGIAIIGRGPATANAIHGATYASRSGSRVLMIYGDGPTAPPVLNGFGPDGKAFDGAAVLRAAGIRVLQVSDPDQAHVALGKAVDATLSGAVALLLPTSVQQAMVSVDSDGPTPAPKATATPRKARLEAVKMAASALAQARRPLFIAGIGAHKSGAREAIIELADSVGAALATTWKAKDLFRGHPFDCGVIGSFSHAAGRRLFEQADCVVVFGAGLNQRTTSFGHSLPADVPLIQVDLARSSIGRWFHADVALVGDANLVALQLLESVPKKDPSDMPLRTEQLRELLAKHDHASEFKPMATPRTMDPRSLAIELDRLLPPTRNFVFDAGNFLQVGPYLSVASPAHIKQTSDFASIGMGFGAAMGFATGARSGPTVLVLGDGSFLMTMGELETVVREGIPLVIVLMNDCAYGAEVHYLQSRNMPVSASQFPDVDYAPVAQAFGFEAATVRSIDELRALAHVLRDPQGPVFLDCKINGAVAAPFLLEAFEQEKK